MAMGSGSPQDEGSLSKADQDAPSTRRHHWRRNNEDIQRWAELFKGGLTIVHIAERENVDPDTVSQQLHTLGLTVTQGHHMVQQLPLKYSSQFVELVGKGPDAVHEFVKDRVWGIQPSPTGERQLRNFCEFVRLHHQGLGIEEISRRISAHRSTIAHWRDGSDQPYLIRAVNDTLARIPREGWKLLPMRLSSGGGNPSEWIQVPQAICSFEDVLDVVNQLRPLETAYERAALLGIARAQIQVMRTDLFAYTLGIMVGDSAKHGGEQLRYSSMSLDLQFTRRKPTNERLGEFVLMCANSLGLKMTRIKDKSPTGRQLLARHPTPAYRWSSERSPLLAWMFSVGLGLGWGETTTMNQIRMNWIFEMPKTFRIRFVQGVADSDGCVKRSEVEIASVPNAQFFADLLQSLGMTTAHVSYEKGEPLKTMLNRKQASTLPIFNEYVKGYRYRRMMTWPKH